jgi:hypothetical protein
MWAATIYLFFLRFASASLKPVRDASLSAVARRVSARFAESYVTKKSAALGAEAVMAEPIPA